MLNQSNIHLHMRRMTSFGTIDDAAGPWIVPVTSEGLTAEHLFGEDGGDTGFRHTSTRDLLGLSGSGPLAMPLRWGGTNAAFLWPLLRDSVGATDVTIAVSSAQISFTASDSSINDDSAGGIFDAIKPGHIFRVRGSASNNGVALVTSKPTANKLIVTWLAVADEAAGATVTLDSVIAREATTKGYWAIERKFADASPVKFMGFLNGIINGLTLNSGTGEFSTLELDMLTDAPGNATFKTATSSLWTNSPVNVESGKVPRSAVHHRRGLRIDGVAKTYYQSVSFNVQGNIEMEPHAEKLGVDGYSLGDVGATGTLDLAFRDDGFALLDKAMAGESFTLSFAIHDLPDLAEGADTEAIYVRLTARMDGHGDVSRGGRSGTIKPGWAWTAEPTFEASGDPYLIQFARIPAIT